MNFYCQSCGAPSPIIQGNNPAYCCACGARFGGVQTTATIKKPEVIQEQVKSQEETVTKIIKTVGNRGSTAQCEIVASRPKGIPIEAVLGKDPGLKIERRPPPIQKKLTKKEQKDMARAILQEGASYKHPTK